MLIDLYDLDKVKGMSPDGKRLSNMENLVTRMAKIVLKDNTSKDDFVRARSSSPSPSTSSDDTRSPSLSRCRRRGKLCRRMYSQSRHVDRGEEIRNFEKLMVISFRTLLEMLERGEPLKGFLSHGLTITEKAASGAYQDRAYIAYDASVRQRAKKIGPRAFDSPINEDLIRHFSLENSKRFGVARGQSGSKRKSNTCYRFNSETGCGAKDCEIG